MRYGMALAMGILGLAYCWFSVPVLADHALRRRGFGAFNPSKRMRIVSASLLGCLFFALVITPMPPPASFCLAVIGIAMTTIVLCDLKATIIPNGFSLLVWLFGLAYQYFLNGLSGLASGLVCAVLCALVVVGMHLATRKTSALGLGDVKLFPAIGLICGIQGMAVGLICSFFSTFIALTGRTIWKKQSLKNLMKEKFPLAPTLALCLACGVFTQLFLYSA